ncbi:hypothetical protein JOC78_001604 [Bacillus ectoiniformans]|nr:hypothetical protein [Bacillus ectoiniformans]
MEAFMRADQYQFIKKQAKNLQAMSIIRHAGSVIKLRCFIIKLD